MCEEIKQKMKKKGQKAIEKLKRMVNGKIMKQLNKKCKESQKVAKKQIEKIDK